MSGPCKVVVDHYSDENLDSGEDICAAYINGYGQTFHNVGAAQLCKVVFPLNIHIHSATCEIYVEARLYACDGTPGTDGKPTGSPLSTSASVTLMKTDNTGGEYIERVFVFTTPYSLSSDTNYCIVLYHTGINGSCTIPIGYPLATVVGKDGSSPSHAGNACKHRWGDPTPAWAWAAESSEDCIFKAYGTGGGSILAPPTLELFGL